VLKGLGIAQPPPKNGTHSGTIARLRPPVEYVQYGIAKARTAGIKDKSNFVWRLFRQLFGKGYGFIPIPESSNPRKGYAFTL